MQKLYTLLTLSLLTTQAFADQCCEEESAVNVSGEWLYFMPSFDQNAFVLTGNDLISTDRSLSYYLGEKQKYYSSYRIEASYLLCNQINEWKFRYTNFSHKYSDSVAGSQLGTLWGNPNTEVLTGATPGDVSFDRDYHYYNIEGLFTVARATMCGCVQTSLSPGIRFVHLHITEKARAHNSSTGFRQTVEPDMSAWCLGPVGEIAGEFSFSSCLSLVGRGHIGLLASQNRSKITMTRGVVSGSELTTVDLNEDHPHLWHAIMTSSARLGMTFSKEINYACRFGLNIEGGYEFLRERRLVNRITRTNGLSGSAQSVNQWSDFTLNGPFVGVKAVF